MKTRIFSVNDAADPEPVTVQTVCRYVDVGEDRLAAGWPSTAFKVRKPEMTDDPKGCAAGTLYRFERNGAFFYPGEIAGYVATASGTTDFSQDES